jgi:hypothetical protein
MIAIGFSGCATGTALARSAPMTNDTSPLRSRFANAETASRAALIAQPMIVQALRDPAVSGLGVLHLVMLDPLMTPATTSFGQAVLHEHSIGDRSRWDVDYAAYARAKARLSWQHAMDSRRLQCLSPHRLTEGDSLLWGGVWLDGLVVAASGAMPSWDEAFSFCVAGLWRSRAWQAAEAVRGAKP